MSFKRLAQGGLAGFLAHHRTPPRAVFFQHIPKTAGISICRELGDRAPFLRAIDRRVLIPAHEIGPRDAPDLDPLAAHFAPSCQRLGGQRAGGQRAGGQRAAGGHVYQDWVSQIRLRFPGTCLLSAVRDPVARYVSDYVFRTTPRHRGHRAFIRRFPTLSSYVGCPGEENKMCRFLFQGDDFGRISDPAACRAAVERVLAAYDFLIVQEFYPMCLQIVLQMLGHAGDRPRWHENGPVGPQQDLPAGLRRRIEDLNWMDVILYDRARALIAARHGEWLGEYALGSLGTPGSRHI
ncbi:MAG: hypothetical protein AAF501_14940 [Pseudomonadota bacterium]